MKELIELVQTPDWFVKETREHQERHQDTDIHLLMEDAMRTEASDEQHATRGKEGHCRTVDRPGAHDDEGRLPKRIAGCIEARMLAPLARVGFDLPDPRDVVVKKGVEGGGCPALQAVTRSRGEGVGKRSGCEQGNGRKGYRGQLGIVGEHKAAHDHDLQDGDRSLFEPVDQDPLKRRHILD